MLVFVVVIFVFTVVIVFAIDFLIPTVALAIIDVYLNVAAYYCPGGKRYKGNSKEDPSYDRILLGQLE